MEYDSPVTYKHPRSKDPVAWRLFMAPKTGDARARPTTHIALREFMVFHRVAMIGWMWQEMRRFPEDYGAFRQRFIADFERGRDERYGKQNTSIAYLFAKRVSRGDVIVLCHGLKQPLYWGEVTSDGHPRYLSDKSPLWKKFRHVKQELERDGYYGNFRNYHEVDFWRPIAESGVRLPRGEFPGARQHTFYAYRRSDMARWLGIPTTAFSKPFDLSRRSTGGALASAESLGVEEGHWTESQGWERDPEKRKAREKAAVQAAKEKYEGDGYRLIEGRRKKKPFDLHFRKDGRDLHIEVKGTESDGKKVIVTRGERKHWKKTEADMKLFVLPNIKLNNALKVVSHGEPFTMSLKDCKAVESRLEPTHYELTVDVNDQEARAARFIGDANDFRFTEVEGEQ
jgi:hypothetical protein